MLKERAAAASTLDALAAVRRLSVAALGAESSAEVHSQLAHGMQQRLDGEKIPVGSRIIFACDAFSAMITARPYREPMSHEAAREELRTGAGSQFDPRVVSCLLAVLSESA